MTELGWADLFFTIGAAVAGAVAGWFRGRQTERKKNNG